MANWNNPTVNSLYTDFVTEVKDRDLDVAKGLDPAIVTVTNPTANMIRWDSANNKWQKYNGSVWNDLTTTYAISISGSAGSVAFANITGKPTTLSGYGITDAQGLDSDLTAVAGLSTTGLIVRTGAGTAATRSLAQPAAGLTITNSDGVAGNPTFALANDLLALESLASTGFAVHTATSTWAERSLTQPAAGLTISNSNGVSGNPTFALANDLAALEGLGSTGIAVRSASDTWVQRSVAGTTDQVSVANGDGVSANPTISLSANITAPVAHYAYSTFV